LPSHPGISLRFASSTRVDALFKLLSKVSIVSEISPKTVTIFPGARGAQEREFASRVTPNERRAARDIFSQRRTQLPLEELGGWAGDLRCIPELARYKSPQIFQDERMRSDLAGVLLKQKNSKVSDTNAEGAMLYTKYRLASVAKREMKLNLLAGTLCVSLIFWAPFAEALTTTEIVLAQAFTITTDQAAQHIGENATVEGLVTAVSTSKRGNTFINFGGVYPNQTFTGWIPAGTALTADPSIGSLKGKRIKITGLLELYHGKPEIRIFSRDQITEE
jgi:hypothetical protein